MSMVKVEQFFLSHRRGEPKRERKKSLFRRACTHSGEDGTGMATSQKSEKTSKLPSELCMWSCGSVNQKITEGYPVMSSQFPPSTFLRRRLRLDNFSFHRKTQNEPLDDYTLIIALRYNFYDIFWFMGSSLIPSHPHPIRHNHILRRVPVHSRSLFFCCFFYM